MDGGNNNEAEGGEWYFWQGDCIVDGSGIAYLAAAG